MPLSTVMPVLGYNDVDYAVSWLCGVFKLSVRWRIDGHRAQLNIGEGVVVVTGVQIAAVSMQLRQSELLVRVPDVDSHYRHALQQGARIVQQPTTFPYGERQYTAEDLGGHIWTFSQSVADVLPEEWGGVSVNL